MYSKFSNFAFWSDLLLLCIIYFRNCLTFFYNQWIFISFYLLRTYSSFSATLEEKSIRSILSIFVIRHERIYPFETRSNSRKYHRDFLRRLPAESTRKLMNVTIYRHLDLIGNIKRWTQTLCFASSRVLLFANFERSR